MTTRNLFLLIIALISATLASDLDFNSKIIHSRAELGKACVASEADKLIISNSIDGDYSYVSKLDENGNFIYHNKTIDTGYSGNAQLTESKLVDGTTGFILYHKKSGSEYLTQYKDGEKKNVKEKTYKTQKEQASMFSLKNGKIFFMGIAKPGDEGYPTSQTSINLKIYDPIADSDLGNGISLPAYSKYISCVEVKDNHVYCAYVQDENRLRTLLKLQHFEISEGGIITKEEPYFVKSFHTQINFIKVVKINANEIGILLEFGNNQLDVNIYGNSGKDLYYYQLQLSDGYEVIRDDFLFDKCKYRGEADDYHADIVAIDEDIIYAVCEIDNGLNKDAVALKAFKITRDEKEIEYIEFNAEKYKGKAVKTPVLIPFKDSVGLMCTLIDNSDVKNVVLIMLNYPDCEDSGNELKYIEDCPNDKEKEANDITKYINIFLSNPYPTSNAEKKLYFRITKADNIVLKNKDTVLELNKDYDPSSMKEIVIDKNTNNGKTIIEYTVTYKMSSTKTVMGKTCKIKILKPVCVDQCLDGCDEGSTDSDNKCFYCKKGYYPDPKTSKKVEICGEETTIYNCLKCDIACEQCFGPFDNSIPTTNCLTLKARGETHSYCNYIDGYYPYEKEMRTCFREDEKKEWEEKINHAVYLDKVGSDNTTWIWRDCHDNCQECAGHGTDENNNCTVCRSDLFFFCNQTKEHGIPGSCHNSCIDDGCYASNKEETEGMVKMCPCFPHCKSCKNNITCDECRKDWLLQPEKTSCNKTCDYCYVPFFESPETNETGSCINCKEKFGADYYTYGNKCYQEKNIPTFTYTEYGKNNWTYSVTKKYHKIDDQCNMLTACKRGCKKCTPEKSDNCTECEQNYYKEDKRPEKSFFKCLNKTTCRGDDQYPHDPEDLHGGVPIERDGEKLCLNCRLENDSYRQPAPNYYCGEKGGKTYVYIPHYHTLDNCYVRCKECKRFGNGCTMNCLSCRDSKYYDLVRYNKEEGNCLRKQHKCGIYPYYHNYEIAIDEDDCGEDCDVCIYNFICPKEFPYLKLETRECVEFCPMTQVLGGACNVNSSLALLRLLRNPFGLRNPYAPLTHEIYLNELISTDLFKYFCAAYNCNPTELSSNINNYLGHGQIYNLPQSQFFLFNNFSVELSTVKLELEKYIKYINGEKPDVKVNVPNATEPETTDGNTDESPGSTDPPSSINLTACEDILKKKYGLPAEEELMIIKAEFLKDELNYTDDFIRDILGVENDYQLFSTSLGAFLPLQACKESGVTVEVTNPFKFTNLTPQSKITSALISGYDAFSPYSPFYNDICTQFTNENGNDVLLDDRRRDYFNENINLCEKGCSFLEYNTGSKTYTCRCPIKTTPGEELEESGDTKDIIMPMPENFKNLISRRSNIAVFKCFSLVFSPKGFSKNYGAYILLVGIVSFIGVFVFYMVKERSKAIKTIYDKLGRIANPPKGQKEGEKDEKETKEEKEHKPKKTKKVMKKEENPQKKMYDLPSGEEINKNKPENIKKDLTYEDDQLNYAVFEQAKMHDFRSFMSMYWSNLKFKQHIIFTFYTKTDGILRSTKIALFILFFAFYMAFTALFFNDNIMRALYSYKGNTNAAVHVPNIVLSSLCSFIASLIVRFICLGERDISKILNSNNIDDRRSLAEKARRKATIKVYILYIVSFLLLLVCWYYVAAFCAVFQNSQGHYLLNFLLCFIICNIWPVITSFIPAFLRKKALDTRSSKLYKVSQIVSIF